MKKVILLAAVQIILVKTLIIEELLPVMEVIVIYLTSHDTDANKQVTSQATAPMNVLSQMVTEVILDSEERAKLEEILQTEELVPTEVGKIMLI